MIIFLEYTLYFFIYSFLGWFCEVIYCSNFEKKEFVNRGMLKGPICPIYGVGSCILILFIYKHSENILLVFILGVIITSIIEYIASFILEKVFNARWWDYTTYPLNINGRICLLNSGLFGIMVVFLIRYVHKEVDGIISGFSDKTLFIVGIILILIFIYDFISTVIKLKSFNSKLDEIRDLNIELKKYNISIKDRLNGKSDFEFDKRKLALKEQITRVKKTFAKDRRIFRAFPRLKHRKYDDEVKSIRNFLKGKNK
ncbi:MAG: putative ABC transporter permease [Sarcina sp.]